MNTTIPHYCIVLAAVNMDGCFPDKAAKLFHYTLNYLKSVGVAQEDILVLGNDLACLGYADQLGIAYQKTDEKEYMKDLMKAAVARYKEKGPYACAVLNLDNPAREHDLLEQMIITAKAKPGQTAQIGLRKLNFNGSQVGEWVSVICPTLYVTWFDENLVSEIESGKQTSFPGPGYLVFQNTFCGMQILPAEQYFNQKVMDLVVEESFKMSITTALGDDDFPRVILIDNEHETP